jgi:hypothetical protein
MTVKQAVREVKRIFRKIDQSAIRILEDIIRKKERRKRRESETDSIATLLGICFLEKSDVFSSSDCLWRFRPA